MPYPFNRPTPVCIPARWAASRLPGKLGRSYLDTTVLGHAVRVAIAARLGPVHVIADDPRLLALVPSGPDVRAHLLDVPARNGSERIAHAVRRGLLGETELVLNLQADAVGATPEVLRRALDALRADPGASLGTVAVRGTRVELLGRTTVALAGARALYFSRWALPADRDGRGGNVLGHIGVYAYRTEALLRIADLLPGPLEEAEVLEQLRWLEHGEAIAVAVLDGPPALAAAVDEAGDLESAFARP